MRPERLRAHPRSRSSGAFRGRCLITSQVGNISPYAEAVVRPQGGGYGGVDGVSGPGPSASRTKSSAGASATPVRQTKEETQPNTTESWVVN